MGQAIVVRGVHRENLCGTTGLVRQRPIMLCDNMIRARSTQTSSSNQWSQQGSHHGVTMVKPVVSQQLSSITTPNTLQHNNTRITCTNRRAHNGANNGKPMVHKAIRARIAKVVVPQRDSRGTAKGNDRGIPRQQWREYPRNNCAQPARNSVREWLELIVINCSARAKELLKELLGIALELPSRMVTVTRDSNAELPRYDADLKQTIQAILGPLANTKEWRKVPLTSTNEGGLNCAANKKKASSAGDLFANYVLLRAPLHHSLTILSGWVSNTNCLRLEHK